MRFSVTLFSLEIYEFAEQTTAERSHSELCPTPSCTRWRAGRSPAARIWIPPPKSSAIIKQPRRLSEGAQLSPASRVSLVGRQSLLALLTRAPELLATPAVAGAHAGQGAALRTAGLCSRSALAGSQLSGAWLCTYWPDQNPGQSLSAPAADSPAATRTSPGLSLASNASFAAPG